MKRKIYESLAADCQQLKNESLSVEAFDKIEERINAIMQTAPSGSGFDAGTKIDFDASGDCRLIFETSFHHLTEHGYYNGWTNHRVTVRPSLAYGFTLRVSGRNKQGIKDYITDIFYHWLNNEVTL